LATPALDYNNLSMVYKSY